jgi:hypothetical protein
VGNAAKPNVSISANPAQISSSITVDTDEEAVKAYIQAKEKKTSVTSNYLSFNS